MVEEKYIDELKSHFVTVPSPFKEGRVIILKKSFDVKKRVKNAVIYSTALGVYELYLNKTKVGTQVFAPGYTYYPYRLLYQTNCVSDTLKQGKNDITVLLNGGWYCGRYTFDNKTQIYGEKEAVSFVLRLQYEEGEEDVVFSDGEMAELSSFWDYAGFYDGEVVDASRPLEIKGPVVKTALSSSVSLEPTLCKVEYHETLKPMEVIKRKDSVILDFGQNHGGVPVINTSFMEKGSTVKVRSAEILDKNGDLYRGNLRKAKSTILYTKGDYEGEYIPPFTYMGYRYLEISGVDYHEGMISSKALYTSMERTGYFHTSNKDIQKLYDNIIWGQKSNYIEIPTDCPQRDERMGYTGDGHVFALTGAYNYDTQAFWHNWLRDLALGQKDNSEGYIGSTVPAQGKGGIGFLSMLGWGNAVSIIPTMLERIFDDKEILKEIYPSLKTFVECEIGRMKDDLWISPSLGDWLSPNGNMAWQAMNNGPVSNSFIVNDLNVIRRAASMLGLEEDHLRYERQYNKTREAWIKKWCSPDGIVASDYQSAYVMALKYLDLDGDLKKKVQEKFVDNVRRNGLRTGFFGTEHLLPLLVEAGEKKLSYDILFSTSCPGWLYQIHRGATTPWERWDAIKEDGSVNEEEVSKDGENMVSFNHYAFGSVGEFLYQYTLGIRPMENGFRKVLISPQPDKRLGKVWGEYHSRYGKIYVSWTMEENHFHLRVDTEVEGVVVLPDSSEHEIGKGEKEFHCVL